MMSSTENMSTDHASSDVKDEDPDLDDEVTEPFETNDEEENENQQVVKKKKRDKYKWEYNPTKNEEIYLNTHSKSKKGKYMGCDEDGTIEAIEFKKDTPLEQSPLAAFQSISIRNDGKYIALKSRKYGYYLSFDQNGNAIGDDKSQCYFEINQESTNKYSFRAVDADLWLYYDEKNGSFKGKKGRGILSSPIKFYLSNAFIDKSKDSWNSSINTSDVLQFKSNDNIVTCTTPYIKGKGEWKNVFGKQIISQGHNKRWTIKIIPKYDPEKRITFLEKAIGQDGLITRGVEYVPGVGYLVAAGHLMAGNSDRAKRAATKCNKTTGKVAKRGVKLAVRGAVGTVTGGASEGLFLAMDAIDVLTDLYDVASEVMDVAGDVIEVVKDVKEQCDEVADDIKEIKNEAKQQVDGLKDGLKEELGVEDNEGGDDDKEDKEDEEEDEDDDGDWEYKPRKKSMIILQTNMKQKYIGCDSEGTVKCLNLKEDVKAGFLSLPRKGGYVALRSIKNGYYLSVNGNGIVKGSKRRCWFKVKTESNGTYSFQSENGGQSEDDGQFLYFDSKKMMIKGQTNKGAKEVKFFIYNAAESGGIVGFLTKKLNFDMEMENEDDYEDENGDKDEKKDEMSKGNTYRACIYIGIANIKQLDTENGGFWLNKMGYCIFGKTGKRVHGKKTKSYAHKFYIEDEISVEVNMDKFEMGFYVNGEYKGDAFKIEPEESYCLALAIQNSDYDIQIV